MKTEAQKLWITLYTVVLEDHYPTTTVFFIIYNHNPKLTYTLIPTIQDEFDFGTEFYAGG